MKAPVERPTSWWRATLERRAARIHEERLDLSQPIEWSSERERQAAIAFFNAAFRSEESGVRQAHELAQEVAAWDPELAETLRLYGDEEGWHRELLTEFLAYLGGEVRPMGRVTGTFYKVYGRAKRLESIVLTNLMFETIGSTTYRLALGRATHPAVRQMLAILTRDEAFHVPLNVHFLRASLRHQRATRPWHEVTLRRLRMTGLYHLLFVALLGSAIASRRRAKAFDGIPLGELARAYTQHLSGLFLNEPDLGLRPSGLLLALFGLNEERLRGSEAARAVSLGAAEAAADRSRVAVHPEAS